jgi:hypothetical protein
MATKKEHAMQSRPERAGQINVLPWVLLVLVVVGGGIYLGRDRLADMLRSSPSSTVQAVSGPGVLQRIQQLNNLETVAFHIQTVVTSTQEATWRNLWLNGQEGLFVADGVVRAGIDLSELGQEDVEVSSDGKSVRIQLPQAKILGTDVTNLQAYNIETGFFGFVNTNPKLFEEAQKPAPRTCSRWQPKTASARYAIFSL